MLSTYARFLAQARASQPALSRSELADLAERTREIMAELQAEYAELAANLLLIESKLEKGTQ